MYVLEAVNVQKTYDNGVEAVKGLNLKVRKGEVFGFLGPNGAGKSTSINMFTGLLKPDSGKLKVLGHELPKDLDKIKHKIGFVTQDLVMFSHLTVYENLNLFAVCYNITNSDERIIHLLDQLDMSELRDRQVSELSGGQKRKVNLLIGLLNNPELLILDEPSAGMDAQSRQILWKKLEEIAENEEITIILTTHLMETADRLSDRVAIMDEGVIKVIDTPEKLKQNFGNNEILEIKWKNNPGLESIKKLEILLDSQHSIEGITSDQFSMKLELKDAINNLSKIIDEIGMHLGKESIDQISLHDNSLEDVFIKITGHELKGDN